MNIITKTYELFKDGACIKRQFMDYDVFVEYLDFGDGNLLPVEGETLVQIREEFPDPGIKYTNPDYEPYTPPTP
ncbi:hypothetical protein PCC6912_39480 [Chlorogloeopsis fritschii PCC 6912]|uniref:Uncharacterized protein n=1 Tax=Chlorogloeopsis fritschii PCC 6912 TaxID=211165 RepID=A0A433N678_CHLFR|nr:hypothetical protein [Chlorogloeopsis fritschii]RUR76989.1 hypothetical protein PCC6912_39480 [Chlorogloeopsis fritschii PCC 6912]